MVKKLWYWGYSETSWFYRGLIPMVKLWLQNHGETKMFYRTKKHHFKIMVDHSFFPVYRDGAEKVDTDVRAAAGNHGH